jgi:ring-1,2-phenylacetyl-CoA epoxidase subunit PaaD
LRARARPSLDDAWVALAGVADPEIPVVSVIELGIVREVRRDADDPALLVVTVTPTYSGCPATE